MRLLAYVHSQGRLYWRLEEAPIVPWIAAFSGPWGKGVAPLGLYQIEGPRTLAKVPENDPYTDKSGFGWFARLIPQFETERSGFGIHPDGNVPGTRGCIGLNPEVTRGVYDYLVAQAKVEPLFLVVLG